MTIQPVSPDDIETFTIVTNPARSFASSSSGLTGSIFVFARRSPIEKETRPSPAFADSTRSDSNLDSMLFDLTTKARSSGNILAGVQSYLSGVDAQSQSSRKLKTLEILRIVPPVDFDADTVRKLLIKDTLMPYFRTTRPSYSYAYTNYHSLNFFTASSVNSDSVVLFPGFTGNKSTQYSSGTYMTTGALSFDFYINPKYTTDNPGGNFQAGTLFHLSSTYVVSLITGSSKDLNGFSNGFRMMLQLSHSADITPMSAMPGVYPQNLVFLSDDNALMRNNWHHVVIRWGTNLINDGTGSFVVDGIQRGTFCVPSSTISPAPFVNASNPDVLCVGNYFEGNNAGTGSMACWFSLDPATRDGLPVGFAGSGIDGPSGYQLRHPLNAEVHDLLIRNSYLSNDDIVSGSGTGPSDLSDALFYWPPFFTKESPTRQFVGTFGGVLQTPFFSADGATVDPFNIALSFGVDGHYMNLENFGLDFAGNQFPRWLFLTASEITNDQSLKTATEFLYATSSVRKRNVTILPCDDGNFFPNFDLIPEYDFLTSKYKDGIGAPDKSLINLDFLVPSSSLLQMVANSSGSLFDATAGASPESVGLAPGEVLTIYQRTQDPSSNEVVIFDISNLFYGNRILPGSLVITDNDISGSDGKISITLCDDGSGNIFRADCLTPQATWNSIGNVFYDEGLVLLKTPEIPYFGQDQFSISFKGEQNIHTMRLNILAQSNVFNSSSNPSYQLVSASLSTNLEDQSFVYITGLTFHDENLNVVMKTQLAQPLVKRHGERYLFKIKHDF